MIKISINNTRSITPVLEIEPDTNLSSRDLACILLWLETGVFADKFLQVLTKEIDQATLNKIYKQYLSLKVKTNLLSAIQEDKKTLEDAKIPMISSDLTKTYNDIV
jgi:hypothetical protein